MRVAIELNDTAIIIHDGFQLIQKSPGYIIDSAEQVWLGKDARERAYLYSNQCENKFWSEIARAEGNNINQADIKLAMRHLEDIWQHVSGQVNTVVLIVPGTFTKTGLGLLLGICKELDIPVRAMVHQAVLCPYQLDHQGDTVNVDIQLHHTAITQLEKLGEEFVAGDTKVLHGMGLIMLYAQAAEFIAQEFIKKTRLDPMHSAELEQQLYDHLPKWLQDSQHNDVVICKLQRQNNSFEVTVNSHELHNLYEVFIDNISTTVKSICTEQNIIICLSDFIDSQFGFSRFTHKHHIKARVLDTAYYAKQSFEYNEEIFSNDDQVYLNKQLPYTQLSDALVSTVSNDSCYEKPNHVLFCHRAYRIKDMINIVQNKQGNYELHHNQSGERDAVLTIYDNAADVCIEFDQQQEITINERPAQSYYNLAVGDRIKIATCEDVLTLIKVED